MTQVAMGYCPFTLKEIPTDPLEVCDLVAKTLAKELTASMLSHLTTLLKQSTCVEQFDAIEEARNLWNRATWFRCHPRQMRPLHNFILDNEKPWDLSEPERSQWVTKHAGGKTQ